MCMKIERLFIKAFGGLENLQLEFFPEMQIVYGINEIEKTIIKTFIKTMFYGFRGMDHSLETNPRKKYLPRDGRVMEGYIVFSHQGLSYRLEKQFADRKAQDRTNLSLKASGETIDLKNPDQPGQELFNISETEFLNTAFMENVFIDNENLQDLDRGNIGYLAEIEQKISDLKEDLKQSLKQDQVHGSFNQEIAELEKDLIELQNRETSLRLQNEQHQKLKLADRFEKFKKLEKSLEHSEQNAAQGSTNVLRNKSISAKELTEIANQRQQTVQALSEFEIRENLLVQRMQEQEKFREQAKKKVSTIVEERSRLQYLKQKTAERNPKTFKKPGISYASFIPLVIAEIFFLIGGLVFRSNKPVISTILIVLAVLLPFLMVFVYYLLQRRYENQIRQYHERIRKHEIRTIKIENGLQKLEWEVNQVEDRLQQLKLDQEIAEEAVEIAEKEYEKQLTELKYLIRPFFKELPTDDQLDLAIQSLREQTVDSIHNQEEIKRIKQQMLDLQGDYSTAEFYQAYQEAQEWLIQQQAELRTFPEFSESHIFSQLEGIQESRIVMLEKLAELRSELSQLTKTQINTVELENELERLENILEKSENDYDSLILSLHMLEHSRASFETDIRSQLNQKAADYLSKMTGNQDKGLKIDHDYHIKLQSDSDFYEQAFNNVGLFDQINLAFRLALTELLQDSSGMIPLILDDPFSQLDQNRIGLSLKLLQSLSEEQNRQIILFTNQPSLLDLANQKTKIIKL